jgi:hypothetical protein
MLAVNKECFTVTLCFLILNEFAEGMCQMILGNLSFSTFFSLRYSSLILSKPENSTNVYIFSSNKELYVLIPLRAFQSA